MTLFDLVAGLILAVSGIAGLVRGFTREVTTVAAFILAAVIAFLGLRFTAPIVGQAIRIVWLAEAAALLIGFVFVYILFRLAAGALTRRVQQTAALSGPDRVLGLIAGLVRGLVVIGAFALVVNAATPVERRPAWITQAKLYPLADTVGGAMARLTPRRVAFGKHAPGGREVGGYTDAERRALDEEVEKSR
ncbi:MAG: CvpA family protein [Caulobacteraceae bacterium]